jgi:hypothetical protein
MLVAMPASSKTMNPFNPPAAVARGRDGRGHGDKVVRIGHMAQSEGERDDERRAKRRIVPNLMQTD